MQLKFLTDVKPSVCPTSPKCHRLGTVILLFICKYVIVMLSEPRAVNSEGKSTPGYK